MGCCKGRKRTNTHQPLECKTMEHESSGFTLWPIITENGVKVTVATETNGYVEVGSFLSAFGCDGPTARMLIRNLDAIRNLADTQPQTLRPYSRTGISMASLVRLAAPPRRSPHGSKIKRPSR